MDKHELERRTRRFALRIVSFVSFLPRTGVSDVLGRQLLRAGTSIGANYREANRASSRADFVYKINVSEKEAAETEYWLQLADDAGIGLPNERADLVSEIQQLVAIFTRIGKTSKTNSRNRATNSKFEIPKAR